MKALRSTVVAAILLAATVCPALARDAGTELERLVPDDAFLVVKVNDIPAQNEMGKQHPFQRMWEDEAMKKFLAPLRAMMEEQQGTDDEFLENTGMTVDEFRSLPKGDAVLFLSGFEDFTRVIEGEEGATPNLVVMIEVSPEDADKINGVAEKMLENIQAEAGEGATFGSEPEEYRGHTLHRLSATAENEVATFAVYTIAGDKFILGTTEELVTEMLDRIEDGATRSIADTANFIAAESKLGDNYVWVYFDVETVVKTALAQFEAAFAETPPAPGAVTPSAIISGLGLDTFRGAYATVHFDEDSTALDAGIFYTERKGITKALALRAIPELPRFVPADAMAANVIQLNIPELWRNVMEITASISPGVAMSMGMGMSQAGGELGVNIEQDVIGSLGEPIVVGARQVQPEQAGAAPSTDLFYAIGLSDRQRMETAFNTITTAAAQGAQVFTERDFMGTKVLTSTPRVGPNGRESFTSIAFTDRFMLIGNGSAGALEPVILQMNQGGESLWDLPTVKAALAALPGDDHAVVSYSDFPTIAVGLAQTFKEVRDMFMMMGRPTPDLPFDFNAIPDVETIRKYLGPVAAGVNMGDTSMSISIRLTHGKEGK